MPDTILLLLAIVSLLIIWVLIMTFHAFLLQRKISALTKKTRLDFTNVDAKDISAIENGLRTVYLKSAKAIQRVGVVRFNPFKDVGSDQSFAVALLDEAGNGVVFSGIHARATTRVYAKVIVDGKNLQHEVSEEEQKAISRALED